MEKNRKYDIFISYRRQGGDTAAKSIRDALEHRGYRVFFDVESLRSGNFNTRLFDVIDECSDFLVILSPGGMDRCANADDWVRQEIERAIEKEKNIVPVMLRGFEFPEVMPASLDPLRYRNGLEANTQFFDAFIDRLTEFLRAKKRLTPKKLALIAAVAAVCCVLLTVGIVLLTRSAGSSSDDGEKKTISRNAAEDGTDDESDADAPYPSTRAEVNLTNEVTYFLQMNMSHLNSMFGAAREAIDAGKRYLSAGDKGDYQTIADSFGVSRQTLQMEGSKGYPLSETMRAELMDSPFSISDLTAFYDEVSAFSSDWQSNLDYFEQLLHSDYFTVMSIEDKLSYLGYYEEYLNTFSDVISCSVNQMLLPVTEESALEGFKYKYLPLCDNFELRASNWSTDPRVLEDRVDEDSRRMEDNLRNIYMLVGDSRMEAYKIANDDFSSYYPEEGDDFRILWAKLQMFVSTGRLEGVEKCVDAIAATGEAQAFPFAPALYAYLDYLRAGGEAGGIIVVAPDDTENPSEVLQIGDIVIALNGTPCLSRELFTALREAVPQGGDYSVTVLRADEEGKLAEQELQLTDGMPSMIMLALRMSEEE